MHRLTDRLADLPRRVRGAIAGAGWFEWAVLAITLSAALSLWAFAELADAVFEGGTRAFDTRVLLALRNPSDPADPIGPKWLEEMMRDFTGLGGTGVLTLITAAVAGYLTIAGNRRAAMLIVASVLAGTLLANLLKIGFARPRPDLVPHAMAVYTSSFPSSHATLSGIVYLTLGALLARTHASLRMKTYLLAVALLLTGIVGVSRIYLGVHWPTDVLAGWSIGAAWASGSWIIMLVLQRQGTIAREGAQPSELQRPDEGRAP